MYIVHDVGQCQDKLRFVYVCLRMQCQQINDTSTHRMYIYNHCEVAVKFRKYAKGIIGADMGI